MMMMMMMMMMTRTQDLSVSLYITICNLTDTDVTGCHSRHTTMKCQFTLGDLQFFHAGFFPVNTHNKGTCLKKGFKGRLVGLFQHCSRRLIVLLPPNEFLHSSPEAPRTTQAGETSASKGRNHYQGM